MILNIPTLLTLLRIALIPVLIAVFYWPNEEARTWCTIILITSSLTDWFDGFLARQLNLQTPFGEFLDPVADKLTVVVILVLIVQANPHVYVAIPAAIIIGREVFVASLREWMAELGKRAALKVSWIGKCKTGFQMLAMVCLLYSQNLFGIPVEMIGLVAIYIAAILTLWSLWQYIELALPEFKK
ncbi:MAG: CDP-diacylglycerol--glycerol-3-phosphate 3-phosphatidyltransferase [Cycloclasticus sp. symbiont of Poecilosclerida sp. M]|nr:MAG: CDP-diacylglycerol--glycerol-3-phosphate 3-phosphatidyltransferase [Cycloclasticus sp. symbiont of Poecilosclerida sp. M]